MEYSVDLADLNYHVAPMIDKIFKGEKPGEIAFHQPTKLELRINVKTAKEFGIECLIWVRLDCGRQSRGSLAARDI